MSLTVTPTAIPDVRIIETRAFGDNRGWFTESWNARAFADAGIDVTFVQDNQSYSAPKGTVRGLHFQGPPHAQSKLVRCLRGSLLDVVVDIRVGSPTFGQHVGVELSAANRRQLFVPKGFAHGFVTLEPDTEIFYKVDAFYSAETDGGILWNDPALGIDWGLSEGEATLSPKDLALPRLADINPLFTMP